MADESMAAEKQQLVIVGSLPGSSRGPRRDIVERTIDVTKVRDSFRQFLNGLKGIVDVDVPAVGHYELEEIQFSAEISANGDFKLLGVGGGLEATSGVTFTLRRRATEGAGGQA